MNDFSIEIPSQILLDVELPSFFICNGDRIQIWLGGFYEFGTKKKKLGKIVRLSAKRFDLECMLFDFKSKNKCLISSGSDNETTFCKRLNMFIKQSMLSDIIVFDFLGLNPLEVENVIKVIDRDEYETTFILIESLRDREESFNKFIEPKGRFML